MSRSQFSFDELREAAKVAIADGGYFEDGWNYDEWTAFGIDGPEASWIAMASPWAILSLIDGLRQVRTCLGNAQTEASHGRTASAAFIDQCVDSAVRLLDEMEKGTRV